MFIHNVRYPGRSRSKQIYPLCGRPFYVRKTAASHPVGILCYPGGMQPSRTIIVSPAVYRLARLPE